MAAESPSILVTGTPGVGKTTMCELLAAKLGMTHYPVSSLVVEHELHDGYSKEHDSHWLNEDKVVDFLEEDVAGGGAIVDYHAADFFPERWFQLVIVLTCDNTILYDRLLARGYAEPKVQENVQAEIMMVLVEEARSSYDSSIVHVFDNSALEQLEENVEKIAELVMSLSA